MSCQSCINEYLMDKTKWMDGAIRRLTNTQAFSENSAQVEDARRATAYDIREFEEKWAGRKCAHTGLKLQDGHAAEEETPLHEASKEEIDEPRGNIGIGSLPSSPSVQTVGAQARNKGGRLPKAASSSGSGGWGAGKSKGKR